MNWRNLKWDWCEMCGPCIICPECGNNSCNGTYGINKNGETCMTCPFVYGFQDGLYIQKLYPETKEDVDRINELIRPHALV